MKSRDVTRDIAFMALEAEKSHWSDGAVLEAIMQFCWTQLAYLRGTAELRAILDEFGEDLGDGDTA